MPTTIFNQAQLTYGNTVINSNTVTAELVETITVTKTPINQTYGSGDRVTYAISLVNTGAVPFNDLTVTDNLGEFSPASVAPATVRPLTYVDGSATYIVNGELSSRPAVTVTDPLTVTGLTLPAGGRATLIYEADVNGFAPLGTDGQIVNGVSVTGAGVTEPITAEATVTADNEPRLSITKSVTPTVIPENGRVTYTFTIENRGNVPAADTVSISDTFDPILSDLAVTVNSAAANVPTDYTNDPTTGAFRTVPGTITVPAATYTEDARTGETVVNPGTVTVTVSGTV